MSAPLYINKLICFLIVVIGWRMTVKDCGKYGRSWLKKKNWQAGFLVTTGWQRSIQSSLCVITPVQYASMQFWILVRSFYLFRYQCQLKRLMLHTCNGCITEATFRLHCFYFLLLLVLTLTWSSSLQYFYRTVLM